LRKNLFKLLLIINGIHTPGNFFYINFISTSSSLFFISLIWNELWMTYNITKEWGPKMKFLLHAKLLRLEFNWCFLLMKFSKQKLKVSNISQIFGIILKYSDNLYLELQELWIFYMIRSVILQEFYGPSQFFLLYKKSLI